MASLIDFHHLSSHFWIPKALTTNRQSPPFQTKATSSFLWSRSSPDSALWAGKQLESVAKWWPHLEVSVDNTHSMEIVDRIQDLADQSASVFLCVKSFLHYPVKQLSTRYTVNKKQRTNQYKFCFFFNVLFIFKNLYLFDWVSVAAHRIFSLVACGTYFPDQESNLCSLHWERGPRGRSPNQYTFKKTHWIVQGKLSIRPISMVKD